VRIESLVVNGYLQGDLHLTHGKQRHLVTKDFIRGFLGECCGKRDVVAVRRQDCTPVLDSLVHDDGDLPLFRVTELRHIAF
jgi:hypothetical protein